MTQMPNPLHGSLIDLIPEVKFSMTSSTNRDYTFANIDSEFKTYSSTRGESNIDITLTTETAFNLVNSWEVKDNKTLSDHNVIIMEITNYERTESEHVKKQTAIYNTNKVNWEQFDNKLMTNVEQLRLIECNNKEDVLKLARSLRKAIIKTCNETMPKIKRRSFKTKW